jgi:hypothetical protein
MMRIARRVLAVSVALVALSAGPAAAHDGERVLTHADTRAELALVDVVHSALPAASPRFKVVYAHPADRPDRFAGWADALQANVALVQRFLAAQTGGAKALRFDMGTRCGREYVDVQVVHLQGPRARYVDDFGAIVDEVRSRLGSASGPRNVVIVADTLNGGAHDYGLGETVLGREGDRAGAANPHNRGGLAAVLFSRDGQPEPGASRAGWWPEGMLHEITHNLGAVQWSAPHSTQPPGFQFSRYGHCWQGADIMCYVEDAFAAHAMRYDCPRVGGAIPQAYDCGRDDYFNPSPPAGSYLAEHWNVYDSAFFGSCAQVAPACGGGLDGLAPNPPVSAGSPSVAGVPRRGVAVTAVEGAWRNGPLSYAYRWQRERRGTWADIAGATRRSYVPGRADTGRRLRVQVVATNPDGSAAAASPPTAPVAAADIGRASKQSRACRRAKARARRPAARCRGRRTSTRAAGRGRSRAPRTSGAAPAKRRDRTSRSAG